MKTKLIQQKKFNSIWYNPRLGSIRRVTGSTTEALEEIVKHNQ